MSSEENPADCASRGLKPSELGRHVLYWNGPSFLLDSPDKWTSEVPRLPVEEIPEVKSASLLISSDQNNSEWFDRYSSYQHMLRVLAWVRRFVSGCKRQPLRSDTLSRCELDEALTVVIKCSQSIYFRSLLQELARNSTVSSKQLARLSPYIDSKGIVRIGGRLGNSQLTDRQKHPV